jgi:hypothetical protein
MSAGLERVRANSIPDSSIIGVTPNIEAISPDVIERYKKYRDRSGPQGDKVKRCCICTNVPLRW